MILVLLFKIKIIRGPSLQDDIEVFPKSGMTLLAVSPKGSERPGVKAATCTLVHTSSGYDIQERDFRSQA